MERVADRQRIRGGRKHNSDDAIRANGAFIMAGNEYRANQDSYWNAKSWHAGTFNNADNLVTTIRTPQNARQYIGPAIDLGRLNAEKRRDERIDVHVLESRYAHI